LAAGSAGAAGLPIGAFVWSHVLRGREPLSAALAEQKLAFPAFSARLRLAVIGPGDSSEPSRTFAVA
jgi:hypothetical protein